METLQDLIRFGEFNPDTNDSASTEDVLRGYLATRRLGVAKIQGRFAPIYDGEWLCQIRSSIRPSDHGIPELTHLDAATMQSTNRSLTQAASVLAHAQPDLAGIRYRSRFGHELENWAIFASGAIEIVNSGEPIADDDADLAKALRLLRQCRI